MTFDLTPLALALATLFSASDPRVQGPRGDAALAQAPGPLEVNEVPSEPGIAWFSEWDRALAEAGRTNRPMLFHAATPKCQSVPGVW